MTRLRIIPVGAKVINLSGRIGVVQGMIMAPPDYTEVRSYSVRYSHREDADPCYQGTIVPAAMLMALCVDCGTTIVPDVNDPRGPGQDQIAIDDDPDPVCVTCFERRHAVVDDASS